MKDILSLKLVRVCVWQAITGLCSSDLEGQMQVGHSSPLITGIMIQTPRDGNLLTAKWSLEDGMEGEDVCVHVCGV